MHMCLAVPFYTIWLLIIDVVSVHPSDPSILRPLHHSKLSAGIASDVVLRRVKQHAVGCCCVNQHAARSCQHQAVAVRRGLSSLRPPHAVLLSCHVCNAYDLNLLAGQQAWDGRLCALAPKHLTFGVVCDSKILFS